ncbi:MAG: tryptophan synthase subunit alpha [Rothia sp.]|uniref:tryptophan synthase subunit alpha n=1 Tax=Rothia sp. (in: high G+C Gram-positive bacteria) TaxID=1885016 RepID=UPI001CAD6FBA|nr:tryptophan synthase subunit alpha [Rothia sp. (in: high G+C Gram-positive bacteria)]MBF1681014.1 tryptophan synthase subunit alpha [Rothia sp. (in: high G+C Gram-positive bacteria)]
MSYQDAISQAAPFEVLDGTFPAANPDSPLAARLAECEKQGRAALIGYLPVGFPTLDESIDAAIALGNNGADIIELGVPYSDPVMDGPVIQKATGVALENGFKLPQLFEAVRRITEATDAVVVVMTYWNPVLAYGVKNFARDLAAAGGAGMITPDLVPDEASAWFEASDEYGLDRIFLAALSSSPERLATIAKASSGFVYAVSVMGVTGARTSVSEAARTLVADIKAAGASRACVGLGVSTRAHVEEIGEYADGVIVGTALVKALASGGVEAVAKLTRELAGREG